MARHAWVGIAALALAGCMPEPLAWDLDRPQDRWADVWRALMALPDIDEREELDGPHALFSTVTARVSKKGMGRVENWSFRADPPGSASITVSGEASRDDDVVLDILLREPGEVTIEGVNRFGQPRDSVTFDVRPIATAELRALSDLRTRQTGVVAEDGTLRVVDGGREDYVILWRDADGALLSGAGLADLAFEDLDPALAVETFENDYRNVDVLGVQVDVRGEDVGDTADSAVGDGPPEPRGGLLAQGALTITADGRPVRDLVLEAWSSDAVEQMTIAHAIDGDARAEAEAAEEEEPGSAEERTIGWARARALDAQGRRLLAPRPTWTDDGAAVPGRGSLVNLVLGGPSDVEACLSRDVAVCASTAIDADLGRARDPVFGCFGCASSGGAGGAAAGLGLLALIGLRRRRA